MRTKPSYIPLFPDAYLRDNFRLSLDQHGLFLVLMMEAWNSPDCSLPNDDRLLAEIAQIPLTKFKKIAPSVLQQWTRDGNRIYQKRLRKEWEYVKHKRQLAREAVAIREAKRGNVRSSPDASPDEHLGGGGGVGVSSSNVVMAKRRKKDTEGGEGLRLVDGGGK